jgi:hypothetical protein
MSQIISQQRLSPGLVRKPRTLRLKSKKKICPLITQMSQIISQQRLSR